MANADASRTTPPALARRDFLRAGAATLPSLYLASQVSARESNSTTIELSSDRAFPGVITRQRQPLNVEFPFPTLNSFLTPNEQFYIRTHFGVPPLKANEWKLEVGGHVERPFELNYDQLRQMESTTLTTLLECSGNSRVLLEPPQVSIRWEQGGVSNAEWTGVPLSAVLDRAGV